MNKIILFSLFSLIFFNGCINKKDNVKIPNLEKIAAIVSLKNIKSNIFIVNSDINLEDITINESNIESLNKAKIHYAFKTIGEACLRNNHKYFAIFNKNISNILGFPIDNIRDFNSYIFKGHQVGINKYDSGLRYILEGQKNDPKAPVELYIISFADKPLKFPTWDAEQTIIEVDETFGDTKRKK